MGGIRKIKVVILFFWLRIYTKVKIVRLFK